MGRLGLCPWRSRLTCPKSPCKLTSSPDEGFAVRAPHPLSGGGRRGVVSLGRARLPAGARRLQLLPLAPGPVTGGLHGGRALPERDHHGLHAGLYLDRIGHLHCRRRVCRQGGVVGAVAAGRGVGRDRGDLLPRRQDPNLRSVHRGRHPRGPLRALCPPVRGRRLDHRLHHHRLVPVPRRRLHPQRGNPGCRVGRGRTDYRCGLRDPVYRRGRHGGRRPHRPAQRDHHRARLLHCTPVRRAVCRGTGRCRCGAAGPALRGLLGRLRPVPGAQGGRLLSRHPDAAARHPVDVPEVLLRTDAEGGQEGGRPVDRRHHRGRDPGSGDRGLRGRRSLGRHQGVRDRRHGQAEGRGR